MEGNGSAVTRIARARAVLAGGRFALVGVSRDPRSFSRAVLRALVARGLEVVPVGAGLSGAVVEGRASAARLADVRPPVEAALVMTAPAQARAVVEEAIAAGVRRLWFHRGGGPGAASPEALAACRAAGVDAITEVCPFMAMPGAGFLHRLHLRWRPAAHLP